VRASRPTYEKPWPCAVILGWFFREAFKPHGLFRQDVYAFCSVFHFISILDGWLERGTHLFARFGAFNEPLWKVAHSHTRPLLGSGSLRAYQPREMTHTLALEAFHPFTHTNQPKTTTKIIQKVLFRLRRISIAHENAYARTK
jgi:hypothetical protein